jgi:hypothetical protein
VCVQGGASAPEIHRPDDDLTLAGKEIQEVHEDAEKVQEVHEDEEKIQEVPGDAGKIQEVQGDAEKIQEAVHEDAEKIQVVHEDAEAVADESVCSSLRAFEATIHTEPMWIM